ncbi:DNA/RNA non-specific endonuclease [Kurthia huakuii]|uniref:DNA/RNA non-specific endonuclease n=1 Tax=Kurthia huakuii TaxID=1421019 RepID=UPI0004B9F23F|nr:DNA/RNA non-specific endonuclease [Kurthia huakuii]MBM7699772.1 DNA-entry nuclease [Kurthia huakuii]
MKKLKKSLMGVASLLLATTVLAACDVNDVLDAATEILGDSSTTTSTSHDDLLKYNMETDKYNENVVVLDSDRTLTDEQQQFVDDTNGSPTYEVDSEGKPTEATMIVTYEGVRAHASDVIKRPAFASSTHIAGEYADGVYNPEKGVWYSPSKAKLNNKILQLDGYRGYLYNKSHLLAWSLGGDMEAHNLILGTRSQNVGTNKSKEAGGMSYLETKVRKAIYANHNVEVFYQATPIYKANEIIPRGVLVRAYSINDDGKTLNETAYTINTQSGVTVDYTNGTFTTN